MFGDLVKRVRCASVVASSPWWEMEDKRGTDLRSVYGRSEARVGVRDS